MAAAVHLPLVSEAVGRALDDTATLYGSSRWGTYRKCQRAHYLRRVEHIEMRSRPDDAGFEGSDWDAPSTSYFGIGGVCHAVLRYAQEAWLDGDETRLPLWESVLDEAGRRGGGTLDALEAVYEAERLMKAYWSHYGLENGGWPEGARIVGVETPLETHSLGPLPYTARADTLLLIGDSLVIADTKTRSSSIPGMSDGPRSRPDPDRSGKWARGMSTRPQFVGLTYLVHEAQQRGELPGDAFELPKTWVNAIIKTKIPQMQRVMLPAPSVETMALWASGQRAAAVAGLGGSEPNLTECAPDIGSRCTYFLWCHGSEGERQIHYQVRAPSDAPTAEVTAAVAAEGEEATT